MLFLSLQLSPLPQSDGVPKNVCDYTFDYFFHCLFLWVLLSQLMKLVHSSQGHSLPQSQRTFHLLQVTQILSSFLGWADVSRSCHEEFILTEPYTFDLVI